MVQYRTDREECVDQTGVTAVDLGLTATDDDHAAAEEQYQTDRDH